jgi:membrane associated rhomboid family serine protease
MSTYTYFEDNRFTSSDRITWAVQRLIVANTLLFVIQLLLDIPFGDPMLGAGRFSPPGGFVVGWLAFQPSAFAAGALWKPFTYLFLHGGLLHLFLNMLWLYFFGPDIERTLGTRQFLRFYVLCGVLGVLATFVPLLLGGQDVSVTGASGAIMGVMIAYAMVNPDRQFFLFPLPIPINARALVIIVIALNILTALQGGTTSVATHFGGMIAGYAYMKLMPLFRTWKRNQRRFTRKPGPDTVDGVGRAVDNIFQFEDKKRRW